ncbi:histidinol-phosphate transaminase [Shewanella cyperi]|uniref:Histidinol-phosphate aminotransferase n=1 Tax=Shewanella cyperi TaxID=2814292 RepID=A0A974XN76_9GAMM|nr:histidinol-phosphate transaminase [Shewanella cyperi]QSX31520.1 histidinol-phosphate transaminase [Shewanella cyperi]
MSNTFFDPGMSLAARLARPELLELEPYQSARRIGGQGDIWVNANESPFNASTIDKLNRYPECQPKALLEAYGAYLGVPASNIVCGRGADEAIELLIRCFCTPGKDSIALFGPTYGMYAISAATFNVGVRALALDDNFQLPAQLDGVADAKIIFLCNPNNPTGTVLSSGTIESVLKRFDDRLVVVDEAYSEFADTGSALELLDSYPNLVVLRTLSKAFGLAGARCGFLIARDDVVQMVMRVIAPYPVPVPVSELAQAALSDAGIKRMRRDVAELKLQGQRLREALVAAGARVPASQGNFVLAFFEQVETVAGALQQGGVVARRYKDPRLKQAIRISFSNSADTDRIIALLNGITG